MPTSRESKRQLKLAQRNADKSSAGSYTNSFSALNEDNDLSDSSSDSDASINKDIKKANNASSPVSVFNPANIPTASDFSTLATTKPSNRTTDDSLVVICTPGEGHDFKSATPAIRALAVRALVGDIAELKVLRSGALVLICKTTLQVEILLGTSFFCGIPVSMRPPKSASPFFLGVVSGVSPDTPDDEVTAALQSLPGFVKFDRLNRRNDSGQLVPTWSIRVSFSSPLPPYAVINFLRTPVRPYVHRPLQCYKCQRYGHAAGNCRSKIRCGKCSGEHPTKDCSSSSLCCPLCNQAHPAWSPDCSRRIEAREVEKLRATGGFTLAEARRRVSVRSSAIIDPSRSFASVVASSAPSPSSVPIVTTSSTCSTSTSSCPTPLPIPSVPASSPPVQPPISMDTIVTHFARFICNNFPSVVIYIPLLQPLLASMDPSSPLLPILQSFIRIISSLTCSSST